MLNRNRYDIDIRALPMGRCITGPILLIPILLTLIRTNAKPLEHGKATIAAFFAARGHTRPR